MTATSEIIKALQEKNKPQPYDTQATVTRIEGNTAWVAIPGGVDETPVQRTINAKAGDVVQVRVSGGTAFLVGNGTAPPTDDTRAVIAEQTAENAFKSALAASEAADQAIASAAIAAEAAEAAETSATTAKQAADRSLAQLTIVEDVAGTLSWIAENGEYVLTTDTSVVEGTVYFVYDSTAEDYSPVIDPDPEANPSEEGWYVLDISDSQSEFIMKHLAVTSRGLWVLPDGIGTASDPQYGVNYKTLLADDGMYVYNGTGELVAKYGADVQIGSKKKQHLIFSQNGMSFYNQWNELTAQFKIGTQTVEYDDLAEGEAASVIVIRPGQEIISVSIAGHDFDAGSLIFDILYSKGSVSGSECWEFASASDAYTSSDELITAYIRNDRFIVTCSSTGRISMDYYSLVGNATSAATTYILGKAFNDAGDYALATGNGIIAQRRAQFVGGEYNTADSSGSSIADRGKYVMVFGNGTSDTSRSNAYAVTWDGNIETAIDTTAASGTTDGDLYAAITALGWESEVIV